MKKQVEPPTGYKFCLYLGIKEPRENQGVKRTVTSVCPQNGHTVKLERRCSQYVPLKCGELLPDCIVSYPKK
jgi:hypothetical protein